MASASTRLHCIDDEDEDDFDWEAAVQAIDVACQSTSANCKDQDNATYPVGGMHKNGKFNVNLSSTASTRQSTLDSFLGGFSRNGKRPAKCTEFSRGSISIDVDVNDQTGVVAEFGSMEMSNRLVKIDPEAGKTWIYPVNVPRRDYQFSITKTALFSNTLVVLPTGLGKTLIAAVVMYNYFRWFPEGKIVFAAPSRPLVLQQIEACHRIVGIPQEWTIDLTGQTNPTKRTDYWKKKRVFFVTPQVLEKDIHSGSCLAKQLVCLVIDEAHRAMGNYSYCVVVRELMDIPVQLRILALTATPGCKQQTIQQVIDNLRISTLECRNESDPDVLQYVHERKIELIEVAMGDEAVEVNNLLLKVVRPLVNHLCAAGVLQKNDFQTLSPCDLLNSREKFRREPPVNLPHTSYGEIEGYFGVLITLYHVRKLLSSHGISPALEMLEDKLKQGSFARMMSRKEDLLKAKLIMQQYISHGAPSPKLAKMLEILHDHFRANDPQNSRVIIFSNFRGSVRDILNALTNIRDVVKAAEFIGQSSGKALKGQTQKVQQAVLQKFRTGGYNVIVATSIGEEGLDIMEVDLVICFDANVSPLRMIQRMGRTGRKHKGRVVVLACEGSELKGYKRKQANGKAISKHMRNGGINSFDFHLSPRMVPHIFQPEVKFIEMSIQEFVPRGMKMKLDDESVPLPTYKTKLTNVEQDLLAKYFCTRDAAWKPSLIAFPRFQEFPSPVNKVPHSTRTGMLIDAMQCLQGLTFSEDCNKTLIPEDKDVSPCFRVKALDPHGDMIKEISDGDPDEDKFKAEVMEADLESETARNDSMQIEESHKHEPCQHTLLFHSEFVSVDDFGNVMVCSLPELPLKPKPKCPNEATVVSLYHLTHDPEDHAMNNVHTKAKHSSQSTFRKEELDSCLFNLNMQKENVLSRTDIVLRTTDYIRKPEHNSNSIIDHNVITDETRNPLADGLSDDFGDHDLSPRLTNFIRSGLVPESPINESGTLIGEKRTPDNNVTTASTSSPFQVPKENSPFLKTNSSNDWLFDSEVHAETVYRQSKLKRLRKRIDLNPESSPSSKEQTCTNRKLRNSRVTTNRVAAKLFKGDKKRVKDAAVFIEEEAEVSSEDIASDDEEDCQENSSYENSFIDDATNPTLAASTQAGPSKTDMMAIYRRSLLSQSPYQGLPTNFSSDSVDQCSKIEDETENSPVTKQDETPQTGILDSTARNGLSRIRMPSDAVQSKPESRKRKFSYHHHQPLPVVNLDKEFSSISEAPEMMHVERNQENIDVFEDDDQFYEGIDLDAVEQEAAKLLAERTTSETNTHTVPVQSKCVSLGSPTFDLGF